MDLDDMDIMDIMDMGMGGGAGESGSQSRNRTMSNMVCENYQAVGCFEVDHSSRLVCQKCGQQLDTIINQDTKGEGFDDLAGFTGRRIKTKQAEVPEDTSGHDLTGIGSSSQRQQQQQRPQQQELQEPVALSSLRAGLRSEVLLEAVTKSLSILAKALVAQTGCAPKVTSGNIWCVETIRRLQLSEDFNCHKTLCFLGLYV